MFVCIFSQNEFSFAELQLLHDWSIPVVSLENNMAFSWFMNQVNTSTES